MDFFNKLSKKASETYKGVSEKTSKLTKEAKLRMKMNENKSKISDLYREIGKKVYEKHALKEEFDINTHLEEEIIKIDVLSAEIETCLNEIRLLNDKKQCAKCFAEIEKDAKFCNHCGAQQEVQEAKESEEAKEVEVLEKVEDNDTVTENNNEDDVEEVEQSQENNEQQENTETNENNE